MATRRDAPKPIKIRCLVNCPVGDAKGEQHSWGCLIERGRKLEKHLREHQLRLVDRRLTAEAMGERYRSAEAEARGLGERLAKSEAARNTALAVIRDMQAQAAPGATVDANKPFMVFQHSEALTALETAIRGLR